MTDSVIDDKVFNELADATGAEFVGELVIVFLEEAPAMFAELHTAYAEQQAERFRRAAHSLKTNALTFGASKLAELARALELGGLPADAGQLAGLDTAFAAAANALKERAHV